MGGGAYEKRLEVESCTETKKSPPRVMVMTSGHFGNTLSDRAISRFLSRDFRRDTIEFHRPAFTKPA